MDVLFVHGYSETSLGAYFNMPARLQAAMPSVERIVLAAFDSLDDTVTIQSNTAKAAAESLLER